VVDDNVLRDFARLGATEEQLSEMAAQAARAAEEDEADFEIWPENWDIVQLFMAVSTQWRKTAMVGAAKAIVIYDALDYSAVEAVMRMHNVAKRHKPELFWGLQVMESEAAKVLNDR
jgi:hypothetical protein